jgi:hypothetical protein
MLNGESLMKTEESLKMLCCLERLFAYLTCKFVFDGIFCLMLIVNLFQLRFF